jgi:hypothetical protein
VHAAGQAEGNDGRIFPDLAHLTAENRLFIPIPTTYPVEQVRAAHEELAGRSRTRKNRAGIRCSELKTAPVEGSTALPVDGQILCFGVFEHALMAAFTPESRLLRATERSRWIRDDRAVDSHHSGIKLLTDA